MVTDGLFGGFASVPCRRNRILLAFFFLLGLLGGAAGACLHGHPVSVMRGAFGPVSILRLWAVLGFPFLIAFLVRVFDPFFLIPVCFCRAFFFSYVHCTLAAAFHPAGWLYRLGLHSSLFLSLPLFFLFCTRLLCRRRAGPAEFGILLLTALAGVFDQIIAAPRFLALLSR